MIVACQRITITLVIDMKGNFSCGNRIKELRNERSLSQERLALNAGITPAYLGLVERGKRNATVATVERICSAMNISLSAFFSTADNTSQAEDDVGKQILCQLNGLSREEKIAFLHLVKQVLYIQKLGNKSIDVSGEV